MNFRWKDFFYYQKNDRNAIVILLLLIVIAGILVIKRDSLFDNSETHLLDNEFDKFQDEMTDIVISEPVKDEKETSIKTTNTKTTQQLPKLKQGETIDLNAATTETLKRIPGIGEEYAQRIYTYKKQLGGFISVEQIKEIQGFSGKRYEKTVPYLTIKKTHSKIMLNKHSADKLLNHPYLNEKQVKSIIEKREQNQIINNIDELGRLSGFTPRDIDRLASYISFE